MAPVELRLIDQYDTTRKEPMKVLVLGMCRTGTNSMRVALSKLGYMPHHMYEVMNNPGQIPLWDEAFKLQHFRNELPSSLANAKPYGREEFDKLLANYDAVTDCPSVNFAEQLIEAYPEAKVVLTTRSYSSWERSMKSSILMLLQWKLFRAMAFLNVGFGKFIGLAMKAMKTFNFSFEGGPQMQHAYEAHYARVKELVPKNNLLIFDTFEWEPLCKFLGQKVPDEPYPNTNDTKELVGGFGAMWRQMILVGVVLPAFAVGGAVIAWLWRDDLQDAQSAMRNLMN